jgi:hypothetical protein
MLLREAKVIRRETTIAHLQEVIHQTPVAIILVVDLQEGIMVEEVTVEEDHPAGEDNS